MMIHIGYAAACLPLGFVFGFAVSVLCDKAMLSHWRNKCSEYANAHASLWLAARDVLSDAFYKKLTRRYRERMAEK